MALSSTPSFGSQGVFQRFFYCSLKNTSGFLIYQERTLSDHAVVNSLSLFVCSNNEPSGGIYNSNIIKA